MSAPAALQLEDLVTAVYCALDDALAEARITCRNGKLLPRRGPAPEMDDREVLCLAVLQELLGFESDNAYFRWLHNNALLKRLFPTLLTRQKFAERRVLLTPLLQKLCRAFCALHGEAAPPFSVIDSHPVSVCEVVRSKRGGRRLEGLSATGYCASLKKYFHGVREHLVFTPGGYVSEVLTTSGNRHDVNGLYELLKRPFSGALLGDSAYQPNQELRRRLEGAGIRVHAEQRRNAREPRPEYFRRWLHQRRSAIERRIGLYNRQFQASRTLNRSARHYKARRWTKALAHNCSRHVNAEQGRPVESTAHFRAAA